MKIIVERSEIEKDCPPDQVNISLGQHKRYATLLGDFIHANVVEYKNSDCGEEFLVTREGKTLKISCTGKNSFIVIS